MTNDKRKAVLHNAVSNIIISMNRHFHVDIGRFLYIDPELYIINPSYTLKYPYMHIPFWAGDESALKYILHTTVVSDCIFISIKNSSDKEILTLWTDSLSINNADINLGKYLYIADRIYKDIKLGVDTPHSDIIEIETLTKSLQMLWGGISPGPKRQLYSESLLQALSKKYGQMLIRTELESDAFTKEQE